MTAARSDRAAGISHMIFPYAGTNQYLSGMLAYIERAHRSGETVVVAAPEERRAALDAHLPDDGKVVFMDVAALGRNPARLIPAWREWLERRADAGTGAVCGINEPRWPSGDARQEEAAHEEWLLNHVFAHAPAWSLLCPVDIGANRPAAVEALARSHPFVWNGTEQTAAADFLADVHEFAELPAPPANAEHATYRLEDLAAVRERILRWARSQGLTESRARDLELAVNEVVVNGLRYGGGWGTLAWWAGDDALLCDLRDAGVIGDRLVGRSRPGPDQSRGRGLWFVHQLCDLVQIRSTPTGGTQVRLWIDLP